MFLCAIHTGGAWRFPPPTKSPSRRCLPSWNLPIPPRSNNSPFAEEEEETTSFPFPFPIPMSDSVTVLPLRWETTGEEWWFASPIDCAAANGHYECVKRLILLDNNLLVRLTSLSRIRRLESAWEESESDDRRFDRVSKCRSVVARRLLHECERDRGYNSLIRAGYGGWLLYAAAAGGDPGFVKELLGRDPVLVYGAGEYGVTDILYAAAKSKNNGVFRLLFNAAVAKDRKEEVSPVFRREMMNRAVHSAARGGNWGILMESSGGDGADFLGYRDARGSTVLHTAAAAGKIEVVKNLISSFESIIASVDDQGNTAMHIAAFHGQIQVLELLVSSMSPSASVVMTNNNGDTFLHMAVSGFRAQSFRFMDRGVDFMRRLVSGSVFWVRDMINIRNNEGRTPLHSAVVEKIQTEVVELILSVPRVDLNACDSDGNTALDLLNQQPASPRTRILIKKIAAAGGVSCFLGEETRVGPVSCDRKGGFGSDPGTCFGIPDAEMLMYSGVEEDENSLSTCEFSSSDYCFSGELEAANATTERNQKPSSKLRDMGLEILRRVTLRNRRSLPLYSPVPLRQQVSSVKRILSFQDGSLNRCTINRHVRGPSSCSDSSWPSSLMSVNDKTNTRSHEKGIVSASSSKFSTKLEKIKSRQASFNLRLMNAYMCFGSRGIAAENPTNPTPLL